ncbi:hypothetical protein [Herbaspirillum sp.]|uniref:hypothetical protein n=1 Tax=Herbaspirillum sp. TaxID=1890675 RepID=UPI001B040640|nr:hypothetical protein [Herbaspirillum sp.]MBO9538294.1 hypothetical protein [Herbaspirillum sp.]
MTLEEMVREFIEIYRPKGREELAFFSTRPFDIALDYAALAKDSRGKRFSHQRRLKRKNLELAKKFLMEKKDEFEKTKSFEAVFKIVQQITSAISGLGELYTYDTALRISVAIKHEPIHVYLHAGTRVGAKKIDIDGRRSYVSMAELSKELQILDAHEVENFLCIYKNELGSVTKRKNN